MTRNKVPHGIGLLTGVLLFAFVFGPIYFAIFDRLGEVSPIAGVLSIVFGAVFAIIGGAVEYALRNRRL